MRFGYRAAVLAGASLNLVGVIGYALTPLEGFRWLLIPAAAVTGLGFGLAFPTLNVVTQERVSWRQRGAATALLQFSRSVAAAVWIALLAVLLTSVLRAGLSPAVDAETLSLLMDPDQWAALDPALVEEGRASLTRAMQITLGCVVGLSAAALIALLPFPDVRPGDKDPDRDAAAKDEAGAAS